MSLQLLRVRRLAGTGQVDLTGRMFDASGNLVLTVALGSFAGVGMGLYRDRYEKGVVQHILR